MKKFAIIAGIVLATAISSSASASNYNPIVMPPEGGCSLVNGPYTIVVCCPAREIIVVGWHRICG